MKLFEHPDFEQAIIRAAEHYGMGLRPAIIEKDYYVTESLRIIAQTAADKVIFKGGTSLSKGWNLIQRFSEDIDIFFDPAASNPPLGKNAIDRELKRSGAPCVYLDITHKDADWVKGRARGALPPCPGCSRRSPRCRSSASRCR